MERIELTQEEWTKLRTTGEVVVAPYIDMERKELVGPVLITLNITQRLP